MGEVFAQRSQLIRKNIWPPPAPLHLRLQDPHVGLLPAWLGAALDQPGFLPPLRLPLHLLPRPLHPLRHHRPPPCSSSARRGFPSSRSGRSRPWRWWARPSPPPPSPLSPSPSCSRRSSRWSRAS